MPKLLLLLLLLSLALLPSVAYAAEQQVVVITANPGGNITCPTDFTITIAPPHEIQLAWVNGTGGNVTGAIVRGSYDEMPGNATSGFEIFSGNGTSVTHWITTEFIGYDIYYRVWNTLEGGGYSECYASGSITGGEKMEAIAGNLGLFTFVFFALVGTIATYAIKRTALAFITAGAWAILGFYCYTLSESTSPIEITDIYMALFWIGMAMVIVSIFEPLVMREKEEAEMPPEKDPWEEESEGLTNEYGRLRAEMGIGPRRPRRRERKLE